MRQIVGDDGDCATRLMMGETVYIRHASLFFCCTCACNTEQSKLLRVGMIYSHVCMHVCMYACMYV